MLCSYSCDQPCNPSAESRRGIVGHPRGRGGPRIESGTVFVNAHRVGASDVAMEFGGFKQSGPGRVHDWVVVEDYSELQALAR
ncbi:MAG: aldehyde dehydrogenase family protein [Acidobacteria bacterium]|nr:aldehyde dehydrogenase family protein [Acidobacteriota bacterium]